MKSRGKAKNPISSGRRFYRPRARQTHEHESRVGQAWKEHTGSACILTWHDTDTDHPYFTTTGKAVKINQGHYTCPKCHEIVRIDTRGFAFCQCQVYNDGKPSRKRTPKESLKHGADRFMKSIAY